MTQLSCMYCGRKLQIKGTQTYGKGRCPSCRHIIFIPKQDHRDEIPHKEPLVDDKIDLSKLSNEQIGKILELQSQAKPDIHDPEYRRNMWKPDVPSFGTFLPSYDEITLFTLSISFILLFFMNYKLRADLLRAIIATGDIRIMAISLLSAAGMLLSFANVFVRREKYDFEKWLMLVFAVFVTAGTGIYSGYIIWAESKGWFLIFPLWNIVNGVILLVLLRLGIVDTDCIIENDADFLQVLISVAAVGIILWLCNYVFKMHWVISYSICVCYTITINDALHSILGINTSNPATTQEAD
jgi:DNA-directed RNA polymerase subunit RPC12/RpoP